MTSADYKEEPTLAVISFCVSNCKLFISWAKWICLESSRMYRMFTTRRSSNFNACYLGHRNCSPRSPHSTILLYERQCRYRRQSPASSNTVPPKGRIFNFYSPLYDHIPIMECGPAQSESFSDSTWRHCIIGSRRTQRSGPIFTDWNVQNLFSTCYRDII
jgi:hypothetical protein